ncbi:MAG: zf-HC2 domain-containing protein [Firmicutes bacterium]|nr:zf-HC2 domain-containing protein [Bacillota bacterium]
MTCPDENVLAFYALAALDPKRSSQITAHLAECPSCRHETERLLGLARALRGTLPWREPPKSVVADAILSSGPRAGRALSQHGEPSAALSWTKIPAKATRAREGAPPDGSSIRAAVEGDCIRGQVFDLPGEDATDVTVLLVNESGHVVRETQADRLGCFEFRGVPAGVCTILADCRGRFAVEQIELEVASDARR